MSAYDSLTDAMATLVTPAQSPKAAVARGLLDFLTYRALRLSGGLPPDKAQRELIATLHALLLPDE